MVQVLRLTVGSLVILFNGEGGEYRAIISTITKKTVTLEIQVFDNLDLESRLNICLVQGVSRGERMDYTLQKATELGVTGISPLNTERTVVNLKAERSIKRVTHWQKIVNSACEQCGRNVVPQVMQVNKFTHWITEQAADPVDDRRIKVLLDHRAQQSISSLFDSLPNKPSSVVLLIGPEGELTEQENDFAIQAGFSPVQLGPRVLRTETAAVVALSILQSISGDLC